MAFFTRLSDGKPGYPEPSRQGANDLIVAAIALTVLGQFVFVLFLDLIS
jgi:hypothetical protein